MKNNKVAQTRSNANYEVNLKSFFQKVVQNKWLFILSLLLCLALAFAYIKVATPKYEASTSILIDASGNSRNLGGDSKYVDGGVGLIDVEKNLYNEIGIIKSFSLIRKTVEDLGFDVSYYATDLLKKRENYGYFPFEAKLDKEKAQLFGVPFEVEILSNNKFRLTLESNKFTVSNPANGSTRMIEKDFRFFKEFSFGEEINHSYFNFTLEKPDYNVSPEEFEGQGLSFTINNLDGVANNYQSEISVGNIDIQASIFKIATSGPVVDKEIDFLQKLTENYIEGKLISRNNVASAKEIFIRNQLKVVSDSLSKVEEKLQVFKKEKSALNLGATARNALGKTSNIQVQRAKTRMNIQYFNSLIQDVVSNRDSEDFVLPTAVGIEDPLINASIIELKKLYGERSKKKFYVTNNNEEMSILNKQIDQATDLLLNNLRNAVKSSEYSLGRLNAQLSSFNGVISSLPERENQLLSIERQSTLYENLFNYLSQELAKTGIAGAENTSDTKVLDAARMVGSGPVAPQKMLIMALALIVGLMLPLAWIVLFSSNDLIENIEQIMANTEIPVIASIVNHDTSARKAKSDVSLWKLKESFRDLTTNLRFVSSEDHNVLGISSILPEEGKTYNAINLGITLAEAGKKTLIIDADMRNPSLVNRISKVDGKGLSNYLEGSVNSYGDIIHDYEGLTNLKFIPTALAKENVHELLSSSKMKLLVEELKEKFDYIIIDTPAVGLVSDFLILSEVIDINLYVVRRKVAKIKFLEDLENLFPNGKKRNFIIFNDVPKRDHKYGYEDKYGRNKEKPLVDKSFSV